MQAPLLIVLILIAIVATGILIYYAAWKLPVEARERMRGSVRAFAHAAERRAGGKMGRSEDVAAVALLLGKRLSLRRRDLERLELGAYLRHIGITAIPYRILHRPQQLRTLAENATYERHPEIGGAMLELIPSLKSVGALVQFQAAWWDGSHTPYLPAQMEIPVEARILAVADGFVGYFVNEGIEAALRYIEEGRGTRFDPSVVDALLESGLPTISREANVGSQSATG